METITVRGARTHNLKNITLEIPRDKLTVITGLSGSGKSSLAFDTLYAEGQRRYVESLSAYARQFLSMMEKPEVEHIEGLSPAISIEQKSTSHNPRSTVGTVTEIYDYMRLMFARVGEPRCPKHGKTLNAQTISQMVDVVMAMPKDTKLMILAPMVRERKGEFKQLFQDLRAQGFIRARIDGEVYELEEPPKLNLRTKHNIDVVIDRIKVRDDLEARLAESFEMATRIAEGLASVVTLEDKPTEHVFSSKYACPQCGYNLPELEPRIFSFNNPVGACSTCDGLGTKQFFDAELLIRDPELSLEDGAIKHWDKHNVFYYQMLKTIAEHYKFSLKTPFNKLTKKQQKIIMEGSGKDKLLFRYTSKRGRVFEKTIPFEGVLKNFERRYRETDSNMIREDLSRYLTYEACDDCQGMRLNESALNIFIQEQNIAQLCELSIQKLLDFFSKIKLKGTRQEIAEKILKEVNERLQFLVNVGLNYLNLSRSSETLSGGEAQRIRLASQIGSGLVGVMYILDEPSIGLHQRDNERLLKTLTHLRDLGNTVLVVEHDEEAIRSADNVIDMGPGAGVHGGEIVAQGDVKAIMKSKKSVTGKYLSGKEKIEVPKKRVPVSERGYLTLNGASSHNLKDVSVEFPIGLFTCITGVSGSGKSTLVNDTLYPVAANTFNRGSHRKPAAHESIEGLENFDKVIDINQSPIGRTPRSNPATYTGVFTPVRELFAATPEARSRGYKVGRFSFNVKGGRCEACQGDGMIKVEMHFLPDMYVTCDVCHGKRYNRETLEILYKAKNIHQVLDMTIEDAFEFFQAVPVIKRKLKTLLDVGLGYIKLGQGATTLSGGEAQRVKLAKELSKRDTGKTLYILDEPTTGLHFHDIKQLLQVLHHLRDHGNTILVIEHNLDVIKTADWIVDLGPEGGDGGGQIIATGTPEQVAKVKKSYTGQFLKPYLKVVSKLKKTQAVVE